MKRVKQLFLFTGITVIAIALLRWLLEAFDWRSPLFAFLVNWLVMSWVATSSEVIQLAFAPGYYAIKPFEQGGRLYERLGIRFFKRLVRRGPLAIFSLNLRLPAEKTVPGLRLLEGKMRNAETLHVLIFLIMFLFVGYALLQGWLDAVGWLLFFDLLLNVYPVMLQRYNRIRLQELIRQQTQGEKETIIMTTISSGHINPIDAVRKQDSVSKKNVQELFRRLLLVSAIVLAVVIAIRPLAVPPPLSTAVTGGFSVERALADLTMITAAPRVPGSSGYESAAAYLVAELEALGLDPQVTDAVSVHAGVQEANVGRARNIVARIPGTNSTGAVLLAGHLDSAHTALGASDCGGCAVAVVETARTLLAGSPLRNDVILLIEDGEETTRAGSLSFVEQHPWAQDVRVAFNLEAMGAGGASLLYVTGPHNGWLIDEALRSMPSPVAYSFVNDLVWLTGTGGSDLDQFLLAADVGLGLVYLQNVPVYHTLRDSVANLDPATFEHQGATLLALARHFGNLPLGGTLQQADRVYYNLFGHQIVRYPLWVGQMIALLVAAGTLALLLFGLRQKRLTGRGMLIGALAFLPLMVGATLIAGGVWYLLRMLDPRLQVFLIGVTYDRELYTLAFVVLSVGLMLAGYSWLHRRQSADLSVGALLWWVALAVLTAFQLPGSSYAFTLPALCGLLMLAAIIFLDPGSHWARTLVLALGAAGALLVMAPVINFLGIFSGRAEVLMGLPLIAMLPAPFVALLTGLLLPICEEGTPGRRGLVASALVVLAVLILAGVALTARFTPARPKPNMVAYVLDATTSQAHWVTGAERVAGQRASLLDEWTSQFFTQTVEESFYSPWGSPAENNPAYRSPAPALNLPAPTVEVLEQMTDESGLRHLRLRLSSPRQAARMIVYLTTTGQIVEATVAGRPMVQVSAHNPQSALFFNIHAAAEDGLEVTLTLKDSAPVTLQLEDHVYSLPTIDGLAIRPRPEWMIPSPTFVTDATIVRQRITIP